jgi:hypothetical protein
MAYTTEQSPVIVNVGRFDFFGIFIPGLILALVLLYIGARVWPITSSIAHLTQALPQLDAPANGTKNVNGPSGRAPSLRFHSSVQSENAQETVERRSS